MNWASVASTSSQRFPRIVSNRLNPRRFAALLFFSALIFALQPPTSAEESAGVPTRIAAKVLRHGNRSDIELEWTVTVSSGRRTLSNLNRKGPMDGDFVALTSPPLSGDRGGGRLRFRWIDRNVLSGEYTYVTELIDDYGVLRSAPYVVNVSATTREARSALGIFGGISLALLGLGFLFFMLKEPLAVRRYIHRERIREMPRVSFGKQVTVRRAGDLTLAEEETSWAKNLSEGGLFYVSDSPLPHRGDSIELSFSLTSEPGTQFKRKGRVIWIHQPGEASHGGVGVQFEDTLDQTQLALLRRFIGNRAHQVGMGHRARAPSDRSSRRI